MCYLVVASNVMGSLLGNAGFRVGVYLESVAGPPGAAGGGSVFGVGGAYLGSAMGGWIIDFAHGRN